MRRRKKIDLGSGEIVAKSSPKKVLGLKIFAHSKKLHFPITFLLITYKDDCFLLKSYYNTN
jgi:hypothetical protein